MTVEKDKIVQFHPDKPETFVYLATALHNLKARVDVPTWTEFLKALATVVDHHVIGGLINQPDHSSLPHWQGRAKALTVVSEVADRCTDIARWYADKLKERQNGNPGQ
jgi:hypothetical protein